MRDFPISTFELASQPESRSLSTLHLCHSLVSPLLSSRLAHLPTLPPFDNFAVTSLRLFFLASPYTLRLYSPDSPCLYPVDITSLPCSYLTLTFNNLVIIFSLVVGISSSFLFILIVYFSPSMLLLFSRPSFVAHSRLTAVSKWG